MRTLKIVVSFDGTGYSGWQRQADSPTIQEELEQAASIICNTPITVHGAGRTDAGVHAQGMTAHFQTSSRIPVVSFLKGLNSLLPPAVRIISITDESETFHARFSAHAKTYRYTLFTGQILPPALRLYQAHVPQALCLETIRSCLRIITGTHDFSSFETSGSRDKNSSGGKGAVRTIFLTNLVQAEADTLHLFFTGNGFLRHMVRNLAGTIIETGKGQRDVEEFSGILQQRDRNVAGATAPAHGLTLVKVHYERDWL